MILDDLGHRICILGPSNSGKSTLAAAIGRARGLAVVHLDQLHHQPATDWRPRPEADFRALHDTAVRGDRWVIDGSYMRLLPQRLARATGVILLDVPTAVSLARYLRRCRSDNARIGGLEGARDRVTWEMLHHILVVTRATRRRNAALFDAVALPKLRLAGTGVIKAFYVAEGLER